MFQTLVHDVSFSVFVLKNRLSFCEIWCFNFLVHFENSVISSVKTNIFTVS